MPGETHLPTLLKSMHPVLQPGEFVFCTVSDSVLAQLPQSEIVCFFRELEGNTVIVRKETAMQHQLSFHFTAAWITLTIHSALEAVGLTAAFAKALADQQVSCNVIAGYFHDHLFVDIKDAQKALAALQNLGKEHSC